ncbi:MAG: DUF4394 domain-containing protein, partial [Verrucomicrobiota bacterium]|nr:DUF4394 domain-containing protein [Verrucomicrobiota bacterium]
MNKLLFAGLGLATLLTASLRAEPITALTSTNRLLTVDSAAPGTLIRGGVPITGVPSSESLIGIDFRPATGELLGLSNASRIYSINEFTGVATPIGTAGQFTLNGTSFGFDFNPTVDRIRITSNSGQNLRVNPNDGTLAATDGPLRYAATDVNAAANPSIVGSAYTNSFATAGATILYDIDNNLGILAIQNPPNNGTLNTVGPLGVTPDATLGFDVSGTTGVAYAAMTVGGVTNLYTINLLSGAATLVGPLPVNSSSSEKVVKISAGTKSGSRLRNISTRGRVGTGENVLIGGFITTEGGSSRVVIRAIGPSLAASGITNPLLDPVLTLFDSNGMQIATNDDFGSSPDVAELSATGLAPLMPAESAIIRTLAPGRYTAQVTGKNGA